MSVGVLTAGGGADWEHEFVTHVSQTNSGVDVVRRCADLADLLVAAATGHAEIAVIDADLRRLDAEAISRLHSSGVRVLAVHRANPELAERLRRLGLAAIVSADQRPTAIVDAVHDLGHLPLETSLAFSQPALDLSADTPATISTSQGSAAGTDCAGHVLAIWGPTGAPGRTTVALGLAWEAAAAGRPTLLIDADIYGGVIANSLGLLDESPGLAAACRLAATGNLTAADLTALCWQVGPLQVLTGIARADRWPEVRAAAMAEVLATAASAASLVVLDCGFCLETDEELSYDTLVPRRNGATLAALACADAIWAVGSADPPGLERLVRALAELGELGELGITAEVQVVLNRVRTSAASRADAQTALAQFSDRPVIATLPEDREATDRAWRHGRSLAEAAANSPLRKALVALAHKVPSATDVRRPPS